MPANRVSRSRQISLAGAKKTLERLDIIGKRINAHHQQQNHKTLLWCEPVSSS